MLPRQISTSSQSEIKSVSNNRSRSSTSRITTSSQSENLGFLPKRQYYQPQDDEDTYYINSEGHLQCHQDSQTTIKAPTPQELPGSKEHPIFHKPGSIKISSVEDLLRLYPNSFDRLGSLKGEYDIKVDPTVPPVQHARRKVPIESKAAIEEAIDYMVKQDILEPQIEPTPWVSSVTYPVKPTGEVRPCLDARDLNKARQCSSKTQSLHGMKWQTPASRRSRISLPRVPPSHSDTMTEGNQSQYRQMPPKEDMVRAFYRMASQSHTPARASQTLRPGTQTLKESSLPLYSLINGSTPTCWEGHLQWSPIISHWK